MRSRGRLSTMSSRNTYDSSGEMDYQILKEDAEASQNRNIPASTHMGTNLRYVPCQYMQG